MSIHDEQKKVATGITDGTHKQEQGEPDYWLGYGLQAHTEKPFEGATPLYTTPQQRKPLDLASAIEYADARWSGVDVPIEWLRHFVDRLLKEKNTTP
jgi:hypothetical protein